MLCNWQSLGHFFLLFTARKLFPLSILFIICYTERTSLNSKHRALWGHWLWIALYLILKRVFFYKSIACKCKIWVVLVCCTWQIFLCIKLEIKGSWAFFCTISFQIWVELATGRNGNNDTQIIELIQHLNCGKLSRFQHIGLGHLDNRKFCCS